MRIALMAAAIAAVALFAAGVHAGKGAVDEGAVAARALLAQAEEPSAPEQQRATPPYPEAEQSKQRPRAAPPAARRDPRLDTSECTWVGKRTIRVLMRDDLIAAESFLKFYNAFGCPIRHLGQAFGCSLGVPEGTAAREVETRIDTCWADPAFKPEAVTTPDPAPAPKSTAPSTRPSSARPPTPPAKPASPPVVQPGTLPDTAYPPKR